MTTVAMKTSNSIRQRNAVNSDRSRWMKAQNLTVQSISVFIRVYPWLSSSPTSGRLLSPCYFSTASSLSAMLQLSTANSRMADSRIPWNMVSGSIARISNRLISTRSSNRKWVCSTKVRIVRLKLPLASFLSRHFWG